MATEMECPGWINESLLSRVYASANPAVESTQVIKCSSVVGLGDNYLSKMYRLTVKVTTTDKATREDSLVIKSLEKTMESMKDYGIFRTEEAMYSSILPVFEGYWSENGKPVEFGPRCLLVSTEPHDMLVLSDLKVEGYAMEDRFERLNIEQAKLTLSKVAKLHASGVIYAEREGAPPAAAQHKYIDKNLGPLFVQGLPTSLPILLEKMKELGLEQSYIDKVSKWENSMLATMVRATGPYPGDFLTVLHGDLWLNNQLFKGLEDVKFVDYQVTYHGNPMFDVIYFLFSSVKPDIVVANFDDLVVFYHTELTSALNDLKAKTTPPSLEQLQMQLHRVGPFVHWLLMDMIPGVIMERTELTNDIDVIPNDSDVLIKIRKIMMNNPRYEHALKTYLPFFDKRGFLSSQLTNDDLPAELRGLLEKKPEVESKVTETLTAAFPTPAVSANDAMKDVPEWLNSDFIKKFQPKATEVVIKSVSSVVEIGDNYVSKMYRVTADLTEESGNREESFIIKSLEHTDAMLKGMGVFDTEREIYVDVLPQFTKLWSDSGKTMEFGPKCYQASEAPHEHIVLQDLNKTGFKMANRFEKLDLQHAMLTLAKLAKFHATSVAFKEKVGSFGKQVSRVIVTEELMKQFQPLSLPKIASCIEVIKSLDLGAEIVGKCEKWLTADPVNFVRLTDPNMMPSDFFKTVVHADSWMNNIMFKYDSSANVDDVLLIDYQMSYWGNPITDIIYFLWSSLQHDVLVDKFDELFKHYFDELVAACQHFGIQAPSLEQFADQLNRTGHYASMILTEIVPVVVMERHADANLEGFLGDPNSEAAKNMNKKMFHNDKFKAILKAILPFMLKKGFLDVPQAPTQVTMNGHETVKEEPLSNGTDHNEVPEITEPKIIAEKVKIVQAPVEIFEEVQSILTVVDASGAATEETAKLNGNHKKEVIEIVAAAATEEVKAEVKEEVKVVIQEAKPAKPRLKARIAETINKFTAMSAENSLFEPENRMNGGTPTPSGYPKWLDKFYFYDLLRKDYNSFKIFKFSVGPANAKGENYACLMFRVKISIEANHAGLINRNFMVKVNHDNPMAVEMLKLINFFPKEVEMYNSIYPKFESMFRKVGKDVTLGAKCIVGTHDPADLLIMEDLTLLGYKSADRHKGLDLDHVHVTLSKLAKMHAASAVFVEQGGKFDKKFDEGFYSEKMIRIFEQMQQPMIDLMRSVVQDWKCAKTLNVYFDNWKEILVKGLYVIAKKDDNRFNVLTHGDLWSNNVMYKYGSDGKVEDCRLVDLQICSYNSPALDLHYFIVSSVQRDLRLTKLDHILQYYHGELVNNLRILGYKRDMPTLLQLQKDFLATGLFGVGTAMGTLPIVLAPQSEEAGVEMFVSDSEASQNFKRSMYSNPLYRAAMEDLVPYFERKGYFEI